MAQVRMAELCSTTARPVGVNAATVRRRSVGSVLRMMRPSASVSVRSRLAVECSSPSADGHVLDGDRSARVLEALEVGDDQAGHHLGQVNGSLQGRDRDAGDLGSDHGVPHPQQGAVQPLDDRRVMGSGAEGLSLRGLGRLGRHGASSPGRSLRAHRLFACPTHVIYALGD